MPKLKMFISYTFKCIYKTIQKVSVNSTANFLIFLPFSLFGCSWPPNLILPSENHFFISKIVINSYSMSTFANQTNLDQLNADYYRQRALIEAGISGRGGRGGRGRRRQDLPPPTPPPTAPPLAVAESPAGGSSVKKIKLEPKDPPGRSVNPLPVMVPTPPLVNSGRHSVFSITKEQPHSVDVMALEGELGGALRRISAAPRETCGAIVLSNIPAALTLPEFGDLSNHFSRLLPEGARALQQVGDRLAERIFPEGDQSLLVLDLVVSAVSSIPAERRGGVGGDPSTLPSLVLFPREGGGDLVHDYRPPALVISFVSKTVADKLLRGRLVGAARCYAWHSTDVSLNSLMIQRVRRELLPPAMRASLFVIPFILTHPSSLPSPEGCEICYHILFAAATVPPAVFSALYHCTSPADIAEFLGEIFSAELPFLLVDHREKLLG
jgi:hypothetical protein